MGSGYPNYPNVGNSLGSLNTFGPLASKVYEVNYRVRTQNSNTFIIGSKFSTAETLELKFGVNFLPYTYKV